MMTRLIVYALWAWIATSVFFVGCVFAAMLRTVLKP